jgi:hypothetical protein
MPKKTLGRTTRIFDRSGGIASSAFKEPLLDEIEQRVRNSRDPTTIVQLLSSLNTLKHLMQKGADIPRSLAELTRLEEDLYSVMHRSDPRQTTPQLMSHQMLRHAARAENENQQN